MPPKIFAQATRWLAQLPASVESGRLPTQGENPGSYTWYSPSSLVLIAVNLIPLYGVLAHDWPVFPIMVLFWLENIVIGLLNALRMLLAQPALPALWRVKLVQIPFFCLHYGLFVAIHGVLVFHFFGNPAYEPLVHQLWAGTAAWQAVMDYGLGISLAALATSHAFSFAWNYLRRGEFRRATPGGLMTRPYERIVVLHVTLLVSGGLVMVLRSPLWALLLLVGLKIGLDLRAHRREHGPGSVPDQRARET